MLSSRTRGLQAGEHVSAGKPVTTTAGAVPSANASGRALVVPIPERWA
jgi:hypothetical protein